MKAWLRYSQFLQDLDVVISFLIFILLHQQLTFDITPRIDGNHCNMIFF